MSRVINIPEGSGIVDPISGNVTTVNDDGQLHVVLRGMICDGCSTSTPLAAGATFTGTASDMLDFGIIFVTVYSDVDSATDGLSLEQSSDGTNWDVTDKYTITGTHGKVFAIQPAAKYFRVVYTNGAADQTAFRLQAVLKKTNSLPSSHRIQDSIVDDDDAQLIKAIISGKNPAGTFVNFTSTTTGNFKVSLEELENQVSDDSNTALKVSPYLIDEYGNAYRMMSDNIFGGSPVVIDTVHHEIHCGDSYELTYHVDLGNGATQDILIVVPDEPGTGQDQKLYHFKGIVEAASEVAVTFYEGTAVSANGAARTSYNRNRNSALVDFLDIYTGPTVTDEGTAIYGPWHVGSTRSIGGAKGREDEYVLRNNTTYMLRITNQTTAITYINVEFDYYVHPGV